MLPLAQLKIRDQGGAGGIRGGNERKSGRVLQEGARMLGMYFEKEGFTFPAVWV